MLGYAEHELVGMAFPELTHPDDVERDLAHMPRLLSGEIRNYRTEKRYIHADGHEVWVILSVSRARHAEGDPLRFIAQMQDISARKRSEERFAYLAYHDELTDLPNRAMFHDLLGLALARAQRHDGAVAVLYVDLDRFRVVNDSLGHAAGDAVLCEVAARLRRAVRAEDLVARHSGDEFLFLLADLKRPGERVPSPGWLDLSPAVSAVMRQLHDVLREPFAIGDQDFRLDASIGVSVFPDDAESPEVLIRHADMAMSDGKRVAPGLSRLYSPGGADPGGELALTSRLRSAVARGRAPRTRARCRLASTQRRSRAPAGCPRRWRRLRWRRASTSTMSRTPPPTACTSPRWGASGRRSPTASRVRDRAPRCSSSTRGFPAAGTCWSSGCVFGRRSFACG